MALHFLLDHPTASGDGPLELVLSRVVPADGKPSKARVNGRIVTLAILGEIGRSLVGIAGQNEHHELNSPTAQRDLLDAFAGRSTQALADEMGVHRRCGQNASARPASTPRT